MDKRTVTRIDVGRNWMNTWANSLLIFWVSGREHWSSKPRRAFGLPLIKQPVGHGEHHEYLAQPPIHP